MSRDASVELDFADGTYTFRLAWGELIKLQEARDCGPWVVLDRLVSGRWYVEDISEVIRLGLIGGGKRPDQALKLVRDYVQDRHPVETLVIAQRVLGVSLVGVEDESALKKDEAASPDGKSPNSPTGKSGLPPSTATGR